MCRSLALACRLNEAPVARVDNVLLLILRWLAPCMCSIFEHLRRGFVEASHILPDRYYVPNILRLTYDRPYPVLLSTFYLNVAVRVWITYAMTLINS